MLGVKYYWLFGLYQSTTQDYSTRLHESVIKIALTTVAACMSKVPTFQQVLRYKAI